MANFSDFEDIDLLENPDQRCPLVVVADCSDSMSQTIPGSDFTALDELNGGLDVLISELHNDPLARRRVELSVVAYGTHVQPATPFATVDNVVLPTLSKMGITSTGQAVVTALDAVEERKTHYKAHGIDYLAPLVMLISDGLPTDDVTEACQRVKKMEDRQSVVFFAVGVEGADIGTLSKFSDKRAALALKEAKFNELFIWLSASTAAVSASNPGDKVPLPSPQGWAEI